MKSCSSTWVSNTNFTEARLIKIFEYEMEEEMVLEEGK